MAVSTHINVRVPAINQERRPPNSDVKTGSRTSWAVAIACLPRTLHPRGEERAADPSAVLASTRDDDDDDVLMRVLPSRVRLSAAADTAMATADEVFEEEGNGDDGSQGYTPRATTTTTAVAATMTRTRSSLAPAAATACASSSPPSARPVSRRVPRLLPLVLLLLLSLHVALLAWRAPRSADALQFFLRAGQTRCFSEDVASDTKVLGEYMVAAGPGDMRVDLTVTGPDEKQQIYRKEQLDHGKFTFHTPADKDGRRRRDRSAAGGKGAGAGAGADEAGEHDDDHLDADYEWDDEFGDVWPSHTYHFCLEGRASVHTKGNAGDLKRKVTLNVNTGAAAKDYANVAKVEHLDNLEIALRRMEDEVRSILTELEHMRGREEAMRTINEGVSRRVLWYSVLSCLVMVAAGLYQARYMQSFFRAKKLI